MANQVVKKPNAPIQMSAVLKSGFANNLMEALHLTNAQKVNVTSTALTISSKPELSKCDNFSKFRFCCEQAKYNFADSSFLSPIPYYDSNTKKYYLQAQPTYKAFRELSLRTGLYREIDCNEVRDCDTIIRDRSKGSITIIFEENYDKFSKAKPIGWYAFAISKEDGKLVASVYHSIEELEKHGKRYSKSYANGPWNTDFEKMCKKTCIKELCKSLEQSLEMQNLMNDDQAVFTGKGVKYLDNPENDAEEVAPSNNLIEQSKK